VPLWGTILIVIAVILAVALVALYYFGSKMQRRQLEQEQLMDQMAQTVSILVIDKKVMKMKESGLPPAVLEQTPKYMRRAKIPIVKAKVGNRIMVMMADTAAYEILPVKTEAKVVISGIFIREVKSVRGKTIQAPEKKKGFFSRFKKDKEVKNKATAKAGK
jgi:hypothetical protein